MANTTFSKRLLVLAAVFILLAVPVIGVSASSLLSDGLESGNFNGWTSPVGEPTISTDQVHSGTYAASFSYNTAACYEVKSIAPTNTLNYTYYVYFKELPTNYLCVILAGDTNDQDIYYRVEKIDGVYMWSFSVGETQTVNSSTPYVATGQWYKIQLLAFTGSNSTLYFLVNDQLRATITNQTLGPIDELRIGNDWIDFGPYLPQGETFFDDVEATTSITNIISAFAEKGGKITPSGAIGVPFGGSQTFTVEADANYHIADVIVDESSVGPVSTYTFNDVQSIHSICATFAINTFTIAASAGANGAISPSGNIAVDYGTNQRFNITANSGYHISDVKVNGTSVGAVDSYTFNNIQASYTIAATFESNAPAPTANPTASPSPTPHPTGKPSPTATANPTATPDGSPTATPPVKQSETVNIDYWPFIVLVAVILILAALFALLLTWRRRKRNNPPK